MQAKCLTSFFTDKKSGVQGEMITLESQEQLDDLVQAGYVEAVGQSSPQQTPENIATKVNSKRKADDSQ